LVERYASAAVPLAEADMWVDAVEDQKRSV
jgi:hypothetical protein